MKNNANEKTRMHNIQDWLLGISVIFLMTISGYIVLLDIQALNLNDGIFCTQTTDDCAIEIGAQAKQEKDTEPPEHPRAHKNYAIYLILMIVIFLYCSDVLYTILSIRRDNDVHVGVKGFFQHAVIVFFLAFFLAFLGSLEDIYRVTKDVANSIVAMEPHYFLLYVSYALFESVLITLIAIEFTMAYFVRDHENSATLIAVLLIAGVIDIGALTSLKTVLAQPSPSMGPAISYIPTYGVSAIIGIAAICSFLSSFSAINYAQLQVNAALQDHKLRMKYFDTLVHIRDSGQYVDRSLAITLLNLYESITSRPSAGSEVKDNSTQTENADDNAEHSTDNDIDPDNTNTHRN